VREGGREGKTTRVWSVVVLELRRSKGEKRRRSVGLEEKLSSLTSV